MHHPSRISARPVRPRQLVVLVAIALLIGALSVLRAPAEGLGYSPQVDAPADYEEQRTCTRSPKPGTVALARYLLRAYPATRSMGMMRACGSGGRSEHKDGRAFDWGADVARPRQRAAAYAFIRKLLATDAAGNEHALARRMGIMYFIYNDTIWSSYRDFRPRPYLNAGCRTVRTCSRTLRHLNHVHFSLGYAGAAAQTSWYRARNVTSTPVLHPGTNELDADLTAVTAITVPSSGKAAASGFLLRAGVTYRIVATGTVAYADGAAGDANCIWAAGSEPTATPRGLLVAPGAGTGLDLGWPDQEDGGWGGWGHEQTEGSDHAPSPYAAPLPDTHGLLLRGALRWEAETCRTDHTYEAWYTPLVTERLVARYFDLTPADNTGTFTVYVARDDIIRSSLARRSE